MKATRFCALFLPLLLSMPGAAAAYGLWVAKRAGENVIVYGMGPADRAYDPAIVRKAIALDARGRLLSSSIVRHDKRATLSTDDAKAAIFVVEGDMGTFSQDEKGYWRRGLKSEVPGSRLTRQFLKYGISITHMHGELPPLPAQRLQILPLMNPAEAQAGDTVRVRVLFDGKPLAGASIVPDYVNAPRQVLGRTDDNGEADLFIRNDGINVAAVIHLIQAPAGSAVDQEEQVATLSFPAHQPH